MPTNGTSRSTARAGAVFEALRAQAGRLGLSLSFWDAQVAPVGDFRPCGELCRLLWQAGLGCKEEARKQAGEAIRADARTKQELPCGCVLMALPVHRRRRLTGSAVACYPTALMLDDEHLALLCDTLKLDRQVVADLTRSACRFSSQDADDLLVLLDSLLRREQAAATAQEELANLSTNLAATYEELSLVYRISGSMRVTQQPTDFLHGVCEEMLEVMNIEGSAAVEYAHPSGEQQDTMVIAGDIPLDVDALRFLLSWGIAPSFSADNRAIVDNRFACTARPELTEAVRGYIAVPLMVEDQRIGILVGINKHHGEFDSVDLKLLNSIGSQVSVFLANNRLYADLQDLLMGVLHALTATIDAKDPYTCGHSRRVAMISRRIAEKMELPPAKVRQIHLCGLLHDIGKIGVPESVLRKPGRLTDEEYAQIRLHPAIGARILGGIRQLDEVIGGMLTHHERPDGLGYPNGMSGGCMPLEGMIVGLADSFDAMTSDRTYRRALPLEAVIEEIRKHSGTQFDPRVVRVFLGMDVQAMCAEMRQEDQTALPVVLRQERWR